MSQLPYLDFVLDHNKKDYMEQLSHTISNVMKKYVDIDAAVKSRNEELEAEFQEVLNKMTPDELDAAGTDMKAESVDTSDKDLMFRLLQNELFKIGKVMYHDTNAAGVLTV